MEQPMWGLTWAEIQHKPRTGSFLLTSFPLLSHHALGGWAALEVSIMRGVERLVWHRKHAWWFRAQALQWRGARPERLPAGTELKRLGIGGHFQLAYFLDFISRVKFSHFTMVKETLPPGWPSKNKPRRFPYETHSLFSVLHTEY